MLTRLMVIISQYIQILTHYVAYYENKKTKPMKPKARSLKKKKKKEETNKLVSGLLK